MKYQFVGVVPSRGLTRKIWSWPFVPGVAPEKLTVTSKCPYSGLAADAIVVARPNSFPAASRTTATTVPLSTLAVPATSTAELIVVLESGLSMMILLPSVGGVTVVVGSEEGDPEVPADGEALAEGELAAGEPLSCTKVVTLSPPHPAIASATMLTNTPAANPLMSPLKRLARVAGYAGGAVGG